MEAVMPDLDSSVVSEALPKLEFYRPADRVAPATDLRMKMRRRGPAGLSVAELVALILAGRSAERKAQALVRCVGVAGLRARDPGIILKERSISRVGALRLAAALELHRRFRAEETASRPRLTKPREVYDQVKDIANLRKEHLVGLYLDAQNGLLHRETLSVGSLNTTRTHPREILHPAIQHLAVGFILAHQHPSGGLDPSPEDLEFTRSVQRAGELMGIELYDHVIVAASGFVSMRETGLL
jgi:DNA repair protein RadC